MKLLTVGAVAAAAQLSTTTIRLADDELQPFRDSDNNRLYIPERVEAWIAQRAARREAEVQAESVTP